MLTQNFSVSKKVILTSFADDIVILYRESCWENIREIAQDDMKIMKTWFDYMSLIINLNKTKYIAFSCNKVGISLH